MKSRVIIILLLCIIALLSGMILYMHSKGTAPVHTDETVQTKKAIMYHCPMHPQIISDTPKDCPICGMKLVPIDDNGDASPDGDNHDSNAIRIDPSVVQNMGVTTTMVTRRSMGKSVRTSATLENNEQNVAIITTKVMGYAEKLFVDFTGQYVKQGDPLLTMYSQDLVATQEEYLQALSYSRSFSSGTSQAAKGAADILASARIRLKNWDLTDEQINSLERNGTPERFITIFSQASGIVMEKMVFSGQKIEPGMPLYKIVDLSKIWAIANVYQEDLPFVKLGQQAQITITSMPSKIFNGKVTFISPVLDDISRTAKVRIEIPNTSDYSLKPQMFANVTLSSKKPVEGLAVPEQAVIRSGTRSIVIVSLGNGYFKPQEIKIGLTVDGFTQVLDGLEDGTTIVTSSQFLIDSESNLRAAVRTLTNSSSPDTATPQTGLNDYYSILDSVKMVTSDNPPTVTSIKDGMYYCPMHPEVISDTPSKCPICGMNLVKKQVKSEKAVYTCPMHPEVVSDTPSKCPLCGMDLVKKQVKAEKAVYSCPMHPEVVSDTPSKCPLCGMNLVKKQ
jgi:Cu(I)/Ag(I) efflux system membrane fusion protein